MFYIALDGEGSLRPALSKNGQRLQAIDGASSELGQFRISFPKSKSPTNQKHSFLASYAPSLDNLKDVMLTGIKVEAWDKARKVPYFVLGREQMPKDAPSGTNFLVFQVTCELPYTMEVVFESGSFVNRHIKLEGAEFDTMIMKHIDNFDKKFEKVFELEKKGYPEEEIKFAKAALSNMVGGIGYFYGRSWVISPYNERPVPYWAAPLYTAVPSRSFFPRGFLWDEGFHNLLISQWDPDISKDIISHWLDLLNSEGWIPREQILGDEARAKVPSEFIIQRNENANPPTLILPLKTLIVNIVNSTKEKDRAFLKSVFPRLKAWYQWYNTTQTGPLPSTYRWRGRDPTTNKELNPKTLTSGLDDYPRASHPTDSEYHIDLRCWMAIASGLISDIAQALGEDNTEYWNTYKLLTNNDLLDKLHWSEKKHQYSDYGLHTDKVKLERPKPPTDLMVGQRPPQVSQEKLRVTLSEPKLGFVNAFGYISLFPFLLKIVEPNSPKLFQILTDLKDKRLTWTEFGLRSLGQTVPLYNRYNTEHDPPYWRGAIWINMNYLALSALDFYKKAEGPYSNTAEEIYNELRTNLVRNIFKQYKRTGYIWENYNDKTGEGKGCHPFTGWSALVTLIMAEKY